MSDLRDLYQELILDHSKRPRNFHPMGAGDYSCSADGNNPLCGDKIKVFLKLEGNTIRDLSFQGQGCAISTASASLMTEALKGKTRDEAEKLFRRFHHLVTDGDDGVDLSEADTASPDLGKLVVFAGVREYPVRVKCASLPWHTLHAALCNEHEPVSTE
jgi:nitrogen fixation NifU-like protein